MVGEDGHEVVAAPVAGIAVDHVMIAMPPGGEDVARAFYGGVLGLAEVPKPAVFGGRGGVWFLAGGFPFHVGREEGFRPAAKAHVAFRVADLAAVRARVEAAGQPTTDDVAFDGRARFHTADPFGNRLEIIDGTASPGE